MILSTQILSLIYSFFYGIFFFSMLEVNYKILYNGKFIYRIMISFLFVIFISLLYFIILMKINNVLIGEEKEMGCEVRFVVPLDYSYQLKKNRKV